jgi:hypothetical protein
VLLFAWVGGLQNSAAVGILTAQVCTVPFVSNTLSPLGVWDQHIFTAHIVVTTVGWKMCKKMVAFQVKILVVSFQAKGHL